jgi:hypothetical protein
VRPDRRVVPSLHGTPQVFHVTAKLALLSFELFNDLFGYEHGYRRLVAVAKMKLAEMKLDAPRRYGLERRGNRG